MQEHPLAFSLMTVAKEPLESDKWSFAWSYIINTTIYLAQNCMSANTNNPRVQNSEVTLKYLVNTEHELNKVFIKMK